MKGAIGGDKIVDCVEVGDRLVPSGAVGWSTVKFDIFLTIGPQRNVCLLSQNLKVYAER